MDGNDHSALRKEYWSLVLETIQRYAQDGHALSLETAALGDHVRVSFDFQPETFGAYFAHMGAEVVATDVPAKQD